MDRRQWVLIEALRAAALHAGEIRLYRRGKLPGLFAQRTRLHAELASEAVGAGLLEVVRAETTGKSTVEWVRITPKGMDALLQSESPARALDELRAVLALNQQGVPAWLADVHARLDEISRRCVAEIAQVREGLEQLSQRATQALQRIEQARPATPMAVPWAEEVLYVMERRKQVGLGERCSLADLFASLQEKHPALTIREFHQGLRRLHEGRLLALYADVPNGDAPGPEYALLDGAVVYYYAGRA